MPKTTNGTIKSVIQDWLAECENVKDLARTYADIRVELEAQFNTMVAVKSKPETITPPYYVNPSIGTPYNPHEITCNSQTQTAPSDLITYTTARQ